MNNIWHVPSSARIASRLPKQNCFDPNQKTLSLAEGHRQECQIPLAP
jgi:hypothetical protein